MTMQTTTTTPKKSLPLVAPHTTAADLDVDVDAELRAFEQAERERIGIKAERRQWADNMLDLKMKKSERASVTLLISGLTAAQDFLTEGALRGLGYKVQYFGMSDNRGAPDRQRVRQPRPVQPHLFHGRQPGAAPHRPPRQAGDDRQGDRQELRLRHRRRVRPLPLRHVRHRVPQGPPRRRLRRLPRAALPAAGRPLAGHRRGRRPGDEPRVLHRHHQGHRLRRRAQRPRLPHPPLRGRGRRHQRRPRGGEEDRLRGALRPHQHLSSRSTRRGRCSSRSRSTSSAPRPRPRSSASSGP